jgi:hypothetical protein
MTETRWPPFCFYDLITDLVIGHSRNKDGCQNLISELKYGRIWRFFGYRVSGYGILTVFQWLCHLITEILFVRKPNGSGIQIHVFDNWIPTILRKYFVRILAHSCLKYFRNTFLEVQLRILFYTTLKRFVGFAPQIYLYPESFILLNRPPNLPLPTLFYRTLVLARCTSTEATWRTQPSVSRKFLKPNPVITSR